MKYTSRQDPRASETPSLAHLKVDPLRLLTDLVPRELVSAPLPPPQAHLRHGKTVVQINIISFSLIHRNVCVWPSMAQKPVVGGFGVGTLGSVESSKGCATARTYTL